MKFNDLEMFRKIFGVDNVIVFDDEVHKMNGTILRIVSDKGFGFIKGEDGMDYFFHKTDMSGFFDDLVADVNEGKKVEVTFDSVTTPKGLRAANVARVEWPN